MTKPSAPSYDSGFIGRRHLMTIYSGLFMQSKTSQKPSGFFEHSGCCLLFFLVLALGACASTTQQGAVSFAAGDALFGQGDVPGALAAWQGLKPSSPADQLAMAVRQSRSFREIGNTELALQTAGRALTEANALNDPQLKILARIELGLAELAVAKWPEAKADLTQARTEIGEQPLWSERAQIEVGLAALARVQPDMLAALEHYRKALAFAEKSQDTLLAATIAVSYCQLGADFNGVGSTGICAAAIAAVKPLPDGGRRNFLLISLAKIGQTKAVFESDLGLALLVEAELASRKLHDDRMLSFALGYQGSHFEAVGDFTAAERFTAAAADAAQRANAMESLYLWEWQAARLHHARHQDDLALSAYRRAVFCLQQIRQGVALGQSFRERVSPLYMGFADLLLKTAEAEAGQKQSEALLKEARGTFEQLKSAELQDYFQDRCVARFKARSQGLEQVAAATAVLYPIILPDRTVMLAGYSDGLTQTVTPIASGQMTAEIREFRQKLEKRTTFQYLKSAQQLHQWLIEPILPELKRRGIQTLVIVPDGALRTIPFAALHDGKQYLVENFALATTPGLSVTDPHKLPQESMDVLLNGLTESVQGFAALPNVSQELSQIQAQFGGTVLADKNFQIDAIDDEIKKNPFRIVHIASHGQFNRDSKRTFILTYDGKMNLDALEGLLKSSKYRDKPVELLTLSACQTASGDDRAALGMAGIALKAGARSALASLWYINDQASSDLVSLFYGNLKSHASKAEALRQAQRQLMRDKRYLHASYWAPFLLIGNWL